MTEPIEVRRDHAGQLSLIGDWPAETAFSTPIMGAALEALRTTIKVQLDGAWALYRVIGVNSAGALIAKRIRRGRA